MTATDYNTFFTVGATLVSGIIASIATVFFTNFKEEKKEKKLITNTRESFIDILSNIYLVGVSKMINDCDCLKKFITNRDQYDYYVNNTSFLESDIFEVLDKNTIVKVFSSKNVQFNELISLLIYMKVCLSNTPEKITDTYLRSVEEQTEQTKKDLDFLFKNKEHYPNFDSEQKRIEEIKYENINGFYISTIKKYDHCKETLTELETRINVLINKLK
ncbi:hypothetical protein [Myroides odoratimimus]|uniref:Uncharacterized protein n=1 Tax=Myroides odoratimimus TaxID=76832 RepID=A0AAI8G3U1_9FLAO|nr:hypothetical protein [Myroides odoratimimus]ALU25265.1 hypothetical protein AS202_03430 [Myroides odoratimimus]